MAFLEKFRAGAQKAAIQATAFAKDSSTKVASGSRDFVQGFSLPGEADKAAKILDSFLGSPNSAQYTFQSMLNVHIQLIQHIPNLPSIRYPKQSCNEQEVAFSR